MLIRQLKQNKQMNRKSRTIGKTVEINHQTKIEDHHSVRQVTTRVKELMIVLHVESLQ